jgi:hypothetical protein
VAAEEPPNAANAKAIFEESARGLGQQEHALEAIRSRAGTLLTAASLITAFLGGQGLGAHQVVVRISGEAVTHPEITRLGWGAVGCFIGVLLVAFVLLLPWRWVFTHDVHKLLDDFDVPTPKPPEHDLYYHLAYWNHVNAHGNAKKLELMFGFFGLGCALLAAEAILWILVIVEK